MNNTIYEEVESEVRSYCRKYPSIFSKANNAELFSEEGYRYIDFLSMAGSMNFGHNNEFIKKKIVNYLEQDNIINSLDMHTVAKTNFLQIFKEKILLPNNLKYKLMFCGPTGTNAVEAALKLARKVTGKNGVIAFGGAFHGMSLGSLSVTTDRLSRQASAALLSKVTFIPFEGTSTLDSLEYLRWVIEDDHSGVEKPGAVVLETVQAEGGVNVASVEWLKELSSICKDNNIILIVDDIQVGVGRTGSFFSFERASIIPDIVVLSKSISGFGLPMSLILIKPELDIFRPAEHNGTFRGNNLAFVGGYAAIQYYFEKNIKLEVERKSIIINDFLENEIMPLDKRLLYRGIGFIWGIDFSEIDFGIANECIKRAYKKGLIIESCGRKDSVLKILPPLTIEDDILIEGLFILKDVIKESLEVQ